MESWRLVEPDRLELYTCLETLRNQTQCLQWKHPASITWGHLLLNCWGDVSLIWMLSHSLGKTVRSRRTPATTQWQLDKGKMCKGKTLSERLMRFKKHWSLNVIRALQKDRQMDRQNDVYPDIQIETWIDRWINRDTDI